MNKEDIIRMYAKANGWSPAAFTDTLEELERFAAIVASAEREECKKLCTWKTGNQFVDEAIAVC